jgi:hypothetical protein
MNIGGLSFKPSPTPHSRLRTQPPPLAATTGGQGFFLHFLNFR